MGHAKTSGIRVDAKGYRIINKQYKGETLFRRLGPVSQQQAISELAEWIAAIDAEADRPRARLSRTFREAAAKYLIDNAGLSSIDAAAVHIAQLDPFIGDLELHQVHDGTLKPFINARRGLDTESPAALALKICGAHRADPAGADRCPHCRRLRNKPRASETTIKRALEVVRRVLNLAARAWRDDVTGETWLAQSPLISMPDTGGARKPFPMSWDEQRYLFAELPGHLARMALFKANTGCREEEVCGLRWEWEQRVPELNTTVFIIPGRFTKNREDRLVVLNRVAETIIRECRAHDPIYVFIYRHNVGRAGSKGTERPDHQPKPARRVRRMWGSAWKKARRRAAEKFAADRGESLCEAFANVRVHDLKHTFGRRLRAARVHDETRKALLGHTNGDITTHYSIPELAELIEAANKALETRSTPTLLRAKG